MRNHLNGLAEVVSTPFLGQNGLIDLSAGEVVRTSEHAIREALVMSQIQIGLRSVSQNIDLAVLKGIHRTGINIEIRVELLKNHLQSTTLQQSAQRGRRESLAE